MTALEALLKELEEKADATTKWPLKWPSEFKENIAFIDAANPETIKKLIAVIRRQKVALDMISSNPGVILTSLPPKDFGKYNADCALEDCEKIVRGDE